MSLTKKTMEDERAKLIQEDWERIAMQEETYRMEYLYAMEQELETAKIQYDANINSVQESFEQGNGCEHAHPAKITFGGRGHNSSDRSSSQTNELFINPAEERTNSGDTK